MIVKQLWKRTGIVSLLALGAMVPSPALAGPVLDNCSRAAASPYETGLDVPGVADAELDPAIAIQSCEAAVAAAPDSIESKARLARALLAGDRVDEAMPLLEAAVAGDSLLARELLGRVLLGVFGGPVDNERAVEVLTPAALAGFAPAAAALGELYLDGRGVTADHAAAAGFLRTAAEQGIASAQAALAFLYQTGSGVEEDLDEALRLYSLAEMQGNVEAIYRIGALYAYGQGVEQDYAKAAEQFERAADLGDPRAQNDLGYLYDVAAGVAEDPQLAAYYYELATAQDYAIAKANLALLLLSGRGVAADPDRAYSLNYEADEAGNVQGTIGLVNAWLEGNGVEANPEIARRIAKQAADTGDGVAQNLYGYILAEGVGGPRDWPAALEMFRQAAAQDIDVAPANFAEVEAEMACAAGAASPDEVGFETSGVAFDDIVPDEVLAACRDAVERDPSSLEDKTWLARVLLRSGERDEALSLLETAVEGGWAPGMTLLASALADRESDDADPARAFALYKAAAKAGYAAGYLGVAQSYAKGIGTPPNEDLAELWLQKAAARGRQPDDGYGDNFDAAPVASGLERAGPRG